ncbi:MAG: hypothetical protein LBS89_02820 [Zoogloeaceae bacterium]|nr:hypothetical protein [Zoogloeaceae bacterium]
MKRRALFLFLLPLAFFLSACDQLSNRLGLEDPAKKTARLDAEGKAVGGGCRQSGRAIEDCYAIYTWLPMESVYAGWREMDEYMRENSLPTVTPMLPPAADPRKKKKKAPAADEEEGGAEAEEAQPVPVPPAPALAPPLAPAVNSPSEAVSQTPAAPPPAVPGI